MNAHPFLENLRTATRELHVALERVYPFERFQDKAKMLTCLNYLHVLEVLSVFWGSTEESVRRFLPRGVEDLDGSRSLALAVDIGDLHAVLDVNEMRSSIKRVVELRRHVRSDAFVYDRPTAIGVWYVLEGSMLGGALIMKMLSLRDETKNLPTRFFSFHGDSVNQKWKRVCQKLVWQGDFLSEQEIERTLIAANRSFEILITLARSAESNVKRKVIRQVRNGSF